MPSILMLKKNRLNIFLDFKYRRHFKPVFLNCVAYFVPFFHQESGPYFILTGILRNLINFSEWIFGINTILFGLQQAGY